MPAQVDRTWTFASPLAPGPLWAVLADTARYPDYWPWLTADHLPPLRTGARADVAIRPPLPYRLSIALDVVEVHPGRSVEVRATGDLHGRARLALGPSGAGTRLDVRLDLEMRHRVLRGVGAPGGALLVWAHDRVMRRGARRFSEVSGVALTLVEPPGRASWVADGLLAGAITGLAGAIIVAVRRRRRAAVS